MACVSKSEHNSAAGTASAAVAVSRHNGVGLARRPLSEGEGGVSRLRGRRRIELRRHAGARLVAAASVRRFGRLQEAGT